MNNNGTLNTTPFWTSNFSGYGSGINLSDIDDDHDRDLITGGWWQPMRIYLNNSGNFNLNPEYTSTSSSVVEVITCGDVDNDNNLNMGLLFESQGDKKLFYISGWAALQKINSVIIDNDTLTFDQYCYDLENGWVSLSFIPDSGSMINIRFIYSGDIDIGITNWDSDKGNYLFLNTTNPVSVNSGKKLPDGFALYQNYPNPFNPSTKIKFRIANTGFVSLKVFDVLGKEVAALVNEQKQAGEYEIEFYGFNSVSGVYFYKLEAGQFIDVKKMVVVK